GLSYGGERRGHGRRRGDVAETAHADLARRLAAGLVESEEETEGHLIVRHEDGVHTRLGEEVLADVVSRARAPVAPEQRRLGSARGSERRTPPFDPLLGLEPVLRARDVPDVA